MKLNRTSLLFVVSVLGMLLLIASPAHAIKLFGVEVQCEPSKAPNDGGCNITHFLELIRGVIIEILTILLIVAPIMIAFGGIMIMTAAGSESRVGTGKKIITAAVVGIAIGLGSYLIIEAIRIALGVLPGYLPGSENVTIPTTDPTTE